MEFHILTGISNFEMENFKVIFKLTWNFPFNLRNFPDKMEHEFISFHYENGAHLHFPFRKWSMKISFHLEYGA